MQILVLFDIFIIYPFILFNTQLSILTLYNKSMQSEQNSVELSLPDIEQHLRKCLISFENSYIKATQMDSAARKNNQIILPNFIKLISHSLKPLQLISRFITDQDIMNLAASCRSLYKLIYSPLGFRLSRYLRPVVILKHETLEEEIPNFSQTTVDQLCNDRSLEDADQDDKMAILLTMKTNILATKHKVRQLDVIIQAFDRKFQQLRENLIFIGNQKEEKQKQVQSLHDQIQKLRQLLKASQGHAESLKQQQERMQMERQTKMLLLNEEKSKLIRQKELLIKKIKSQQKQKEEGMMYAKEVNRVLTRLNQITINTSSASSSKSTKK